MEMTNGEDLASQSIKKTKKISSDESESVIGEGKRLIELKIPKNGGEEVMEDTEDSNIMRRNSDEQRVCYLCDKSFKSSKALGGHMRIHYSKGNKKGQILNKAHQSVKSSKQDPRGDREDDGRVFTFVKKECGEKSPGANNYVVGSGDIGKRSSTTCEVCGKDFPSMKSMFGHMRKHPERNRKSSRPLSVEKTSSASCLSEEDSPKNDDQIDLLADKNERVDLTVSLKGLHPTAKRGRKCLSFKMDDYQWNEMEAAIGLLVLAGGDLMEALVHYQQGGEFVNVTSGLDLGKPFTEGTVQELEEKDYDASLDDNSKNLGLIKMLVENKKKRKRVKLSELESQQNTTPVIKNVVVESENRPSNLTLQMEETKENGPLNLVEAMHRQSIVGTERRKSHEIDLNALPASEGEVEAGLMPILGSWC